MEVEGLYDLGFVDPWAPATTRLPSLLDVDHRLVLSVGLGVQRGLVLEAIRGLFSLFVNECQFIDILRAEAELDDYI